MGYNDEYSISELGGKQGKTGYTRQGLSNNIMGNIDSELTRKESEQRQRDRLTTQGNGKYINTGSNDRVAGNSSKKDTYPTKEDRQSYYYGYTTHGGRRLLAVVEELLKQEKYEEISLIAQRDYNNGLKEEELGMVANIPEYLEAYRLASNKGKKR